MGRCFVRIRYNSVFGTSRRLVVSMVYGRRLSAISYFHSLTAHHSAIVTHDHSAHSLSYCLQPVSEPKLAGLVVEDADDAEVAPEQVEDQVDVPTLRGKLRAAHAVAIRVREALAA
jgi:hypothetical protein